jgi:hypothetical protein
MDLLDVRKHVILEREVERRDIRLERWTIVVAPMMALVTNSRDTAKAIAIWAGSTP